MNVNLSKILTAFLLLVFMTSCTPDKMINQNVKLWYNKPASIWEEALPIGNGRLGAMVYGIPSVDTIQFNEDTFWAGGPDTLTKSGTYKVLPEIRNLVFQGKYKEAADLTNEKFIGPSLMPYLPMGDVIINMKGHEHFTNYRRELDLRTAIAKTEYEVEGTKFIREVFSSPVDQAIIIHLETKGKQKLNFAVSFKNDVGAKSIAVGNSVLQLSGKAPMKKGREGKVQFTSLLKIRNNSGTTEVKDSTIVISGASSVDLILTAATNFKSYKDLSIDHKKKCEEYQEAILKKSYSQIKRDHIEKHQELFNRVDLNLPRTQNSSLPTDERLKAFQNSPDPDLIALYYQFGRYLLMSCSEPGGQPANLQGLWNNKVSPPWDSKFTTNINLEMNYWAANSSNLSECAMPLYSFLKDLSEAGKITARNDYNANGWVLHHNTDIWRSTHPIDGAAWGIWPTGGAWLCTNIWERYRFSLDQSFLRQYYPVMKGSARFFVETLVEYPGKGWLVTCPTISPENRIFPGNISICAGSFIDNELIKDLFSQCISACKILDIDKSFADTLKSILPRLAPNQIGKGGYLQEWLEDWDMKVPELRHRHVSHLYGLFPGNQFTKEQTPDLWNACKKTLEIRGDAGTGWSLAWKINLWARLYDGEHSFKILKTLLKLTRAQGYAGAGGTYPNLFDACPPFQIDGNLGAVSGINEMLLQSQNNEINLLPALPKELNTGSIKGICARGGFVVDLSWNNGILEHVNILSKIGKSCRIRFGEKVVEFETESGKSYCFNGNLTLM